MAEPTTVVSSIEATVDNNEELPTVKHALTPPTSEDMEKRERSSSELSELEDSEDDEEIEPAEYFGGGKIPIFRPTMKQFRSFPKFIDKIDQYGMKSGIVKVIPPPEWRESLPNLEEAVKGIRIKNPITQEFAGQHGIYTQANIEKQRSYNLPEWKAETLQAHHQPPAKRGERRKAAPEPSNRRASTRGQGTASSTPNVSENGTPAKRGPGRPRKRPLKQEKAEEQDDEDSLIDAPPTPTSPGKDSSTPARKIKKEEDESKPSKPRGRQPKAKSVTSRRMNNRQEVVDYVDEEAFKGFNYKLENVDEYTVERCRDLEQTYWKTINFGQPMYAADMPGSLFDENTTTWNVAKLPNLLDVLGTKVPGVNTAYLYLGMWKATFAWHLEDVDLYSINYIHFGAPKQWYSISQEDARRFESAMKQIWPQHAKNCSQFLRHKTFLISPDKLESQFGIKVNRLVHYEGEFVITYPYGYHSGYNLGYNCAESVNFANEGWLNYGRIAKKCECESDSVWVDVNEIERKLRGEPTPEYYEETDDEDDEDEDVQLPSPPQSVVKGKPGRKRKRDTDKKDAAPQKRVKRIKLRIRQPPREMPCILCPNDVVFDELLPTDNGLRAHRICAEYTPETYITGAKPTETVRNVGNIDKARLELKCNYCRSKRGAVFQCSAKKCTRAFHATCAAAAGVQVDCGPMPTFDEEGIEYYYDGYDFRCKFHRPKKRQAKYVDCDTLENDKLVFNYAKTLKPKDVVQFQYLYGDSIYGGTVVENRSGECTLLIDVLPDGDRIEMEWKYLLALDPEESQRPKPSANAKPLPEHLKENDASLNMANRTDGVPQMDDPFHDPNSVHKWAEFNTAPDVKHPNQAKVDMSKENRLWYYLGKKSTEAKPQYTEDLAKPRHNTKSNFLDTVKPAPVISTAIQRTSYPASYPIKPASTPNTSATRPQVQPQSRPMDKPYQYKPKEGAPSRAYGHYRQPSQSYQSEPWKFPNSPVAHQPNVVYDHRATAPQYGYPSNSNNYRPQQHYHSHPAPNSSSSSRAANAPLLPGLENYARSSQPTYQPYHPTASAHSPKYPQYSTTSGQQRPAHSPPTAQSQPRGSAPIANMLSGSSGSTKPTSIPDGNFTPEWMPVQTVHASRPSTSSQDPAHRRASQAGLGLSYPSTSSANGPTLPVPRPSLQFQTEQQFQLDVARAPAHTTNRRFDFMMNQLKNTATGASPTPSQAPYPISTTPTASVPPQQQRTPPGHSDNASGELKIKGLAARISAEPQRPIPSPLSDAPQTDSPKRPEYSPISDAGGSGTPTNRPTLPPLPQGVPLGGETWRYS